MTTLENITCLPVKLECLDSMNTLESSPMLTGVFAYLRGAFIFNVQDC